MTTMERYEKLDREHTRTQTMLLIMMTMTAFDHDHSQWFRYLMFTLMALVVGVDIIRLLYKGAVKLLSIRIRRTP
jgi:hypothetical protein